VGVGLDGEQDVLAADVVLLVGAGAGVPVVPGELVVGAVEESLALVAVLADETARRVGVRARRTPPSAGQGADQAWSTTLIPGAPDGRTSDWTATITQLALASATIAIEHRPC
jgi:hypothetical protein